MIQSGAEVGRDASSRRTDAPRKAQSCFFMIFLPLFMGLPLLWNAIGDARFQNIRSLDMVRLMAMGACIGVAFSGLGLLIRSKCNTLHLKTFLC